MINEHIEFLISQAIDGTLSPSEMDELNAILKADPDARQLYADYQSLHREIKSQTYESVLDDANLSDAQWNNFSLHVSSVIASSSPVANAGEPIEFQIGNKGEYPRTPSFVPALSIARSDDNAAHCEEKSDAIRMPLDEATQYEHRLCSYADGSMDPTEAQAFQQIIAGDPVANSLIAQHQKLNHILKDESDLPALNYNRLSLHLIGFIAKHAGVAGKHQSLFKDSVVATSAAEKSFTLPENDSAMVRKPRRIWAGLAIAASLLLCVSLSIKTALLQKPKSTPIGAIVIGPANPNPAITNQTGTKPVVEIQINALVTSDTTGGQTGTMSPSITVGKSNNAIAEITIGAGPNAANSVDLAENNTGIVTYSSHSLIAVSTPAVNESTAPDSNAGPY